MKGKILVVDDEPNIQKLLTVALTNRGHEVVVASNGVEALAMVETEKPDLVVLDVMMPKMDGHQVRDEIRRRGNQVPILFLSAAGTFEEQVEQMKDDNVDYIPKPFKPAEVADHIEAMLDPVRRAEFERERAKREAKLHTIVNIMHRDRE
ncbi:response regulator [Coriobacteriia bacterium Es71-Z0120]|jgi:DNA-binding response OmpR family regulator|uniref:response regulator transcription factor n=1 Tax=Parvivirga hydrogeniphila TaxID=2939460 RepID=UPI002260E8EF|nr:response regulator [Parvivirga hydrogeniphila]MCL4078251.1 response regulator [Parvivirga hydrogeniphila]